MISIQTIFMMTTNKEYINKKEALSQLKRIIKIADDYKNPMLHIVAMQIAEGAYNAIYRMEGVQVDGRNVIH